MGSSAEATVVERCQDRTHICFSVLLVPIVEAAWVYDPRLFPPPQFLARETLVPLDRHHPIKIALHPTDLDSLGDQVASWEPEPFFPVTELDLGVEIVQDGEVPFVAVPQFGVTFRVFLGRRNGLVSGFDEELGDLSVLEMIGHIKWRVVEVSKGVYPGSGKQEGRQEESEGDVAEDPRSTGLHERSYRVRRVSSQFPSKQDGGDSHCRVKQ